MISVHTNVREPLFQKKKKKKLIKKIQFWLCEQENKVVWYSVSAQSGEEMGRKDSEIMELPEVLFKKNLLYIQT